MNTPQDKFQEMLNHLNDEQRAAVEYLNGPLLVLAGPGTGKTQLLSAKVAYILKETDTTANSVLCVTFTDSGCQNMRDRLASMIGATEAAKVHIKTYHTLGIDLIQAYKNYSETFTRRIEAAIDNITQITIVRNLQKNLPSNDILRGDDTKKILEVIGDARKHRLTAETLEAIANINIAESEILSQHISPFLLKVTPSKLHPSLEEAYQPILELLQEAADESLIAPNVEHTITILRDDLKTAIETAIEKDSVKSLSDWRDKYFEKDMVGNYRLKDRVANKKLLSIAKIMAEYKKHLDENGLYDFDDMIEEATNALKTDEGFRLTMAENYQFILLDEFQDTNPSQFEIIKQLTAYENPLIMAVGDDDQAIYEFQGAKATNLVDFKTHYGAKVINLVKNYRSTQDILDFSKQVIAQVPDSFSKTVPGIEKTLIAAKPNQAGKIERHEFLSSDGEYYWVAEKIDELIKTGVKQSEIAILTTRYKYITPILPFLNAKRNIKIAYEKNENVFEDPRIRKIIVLSRLIFALAEGKNPSYLMPEAISAPFWQIDCFEQTELFRMAKYNKTSCLEIMKNSKDEKVKEVAEFLAKMACKSFEIPFETFFAYLIGLKKLDNFSTNYLDFYAADPKSAQAFELFEKLTVLKNAVKKHFAGKETAPKLKHFIEFLDSYENAEEPLPNSSPYQNADDAVQILSVHKAKGLEFKHVFLIAVDHSAWGKGRGGDNWLALPKNLAHIRHAGKTDSEQLRLLFVAITRAKDFLYLSNSRRDFAGKNADRLEYLNESEQGKKVISPFIPKKAEQEVILHYDENGDASKAQTDLSLGWRDEYLHPEPDSFAKYRKQVENYHLSHTNLIKFVDIAYSGPKAFFKDQVLNFPQEPATKQIALGNAIHRVFEAVTNQKLSDTEAITLFAKEIEKEELEPDDLKELLGSTPEKLEITLKSFGEELRSPSARAEVNFRPEHLSFKGVPLTGKIDHIRIDEENKTIEVFDFKTGKPKTKNWGTSDVSLLKYELQLAFYKLLLNLSPAYKKYKVTRGHILFVTPDKDGYVLDKPYNFDEKTEELLKKMIPAVYQHIRTLDFLDNPDLLVDPDKSKTVKDIKKFIELVIETAR